jgi:hypothetical protein
VSGLFCAPNMKDNSERYLTVRSAAPHARSLRSLWRRVLAGHWRGIAEWLLWFIGGITSGIVHWLIWGSLRGGDGGSCAGSGFFGSLVSFGSCDMDHYLFQFCGDNPIFPESSTRQRSIEIAEFAE